MAQTKSKAFIEFEKMMEPHRKLLRNAGSVHFEKVYMPRGGSLLFSLDIEEPLKALDLAQWHLHVRFAIDDGDRDEHEHFLLSMKQARQIQKYMTHFISLYESMKKVNKKPRKKKTKKVRH